MNLEDFSAELNARWDKVDHPNGVAIASLGLCGEAGEVSECFKKHLRDGRPVAGDPELALELGDVLHYWCRLAYLAGYTPAEIMLLNQAKVLQKREANPNV